jgi:hypothetical protein
MNPDARSSHARVVRRLALAALLTALAGPARAQTVEVETRALPGWSFVPGVSVGWLFDSNVALVSPGEGRPVEGDVLLLVNPQGNLEFRSRRNTFTAGYRGSFRSYRQLDELNSYEQRAQLLFRRRVSPRVVVHVRDSFSRVPTTDEADLIGVVFRRTGARTNHLAGGVDVRLRPRTTMAAAYDFVWVEFDRQLEPSPLLRGGRAHGIRSELGHELTSRTAIAAEYTVRFATLADGARQLTFHQAGTGIRQRLTAATRVFATLGFAHVGSTFDVAHTGPFVRAGVEHDIVRAVARAEYERSFVPSFGFGGSNTAHELRASLHMPLALNRSYWQAAAAWRRTDPLVASELDLSSLWLSTTVGHALQRWLRLEGFYSYSRQDTHLAGGLVGRHRVGAFLVLSTPVRIQ